MMPSVTPTQRIVELEKTVAIQSQMITVLNKNVDENMEDILEQKMIFLDLVKNHALLQQRYDEYVRRSEIWSQRWWTLVPVLVGAVLTLASGLVVTLARK